MKGFLIAELHEIATVARGKFSARPRNDPKYYGGQYPFVQTGDVASANGRLRTHSQTLNEDGLGVSKLFPSGTILLTIAANIGEVALTEYPVACPDSVVGIEPKEGINASWLLHALMNKKHVLETAATQNAQRNINLQVVCPLEIDVPPKNVQSKLGAIFDTWDRAIDLTENLLTEKQQLRNGLMQLLLTGKRRLPGITKPWRTIHLGDAFRNRVESNRTDLPLLSITADRGVIPRGEIDRKDSSSEDKSKYLRICPGDIGYNTMRMWQGVSGLSSLEGIVSPAYTIVTPKKDIDGEFMSLLFKSLPVVHLFCRYSQGLVSDTWNLKFRHFAEIMVSVPDAAEQKAIANAFRSVNRELELLQAKADALREQKKGLMQQLLTGKKRLTTCGT